MIKRCLHKIFGRRRYQKSPDIDRDTQVVEAIHTITQQMHNMTVRISAVENKIEALTHQATQQVRENDKTSALLTLKLKKLNQQELDKLQTTLFNLEQERDALDSLITSKGITDSIQTMNQALRLVHSDTKIEIIDDTIDSVNDTIRQADEIIYALAQPIASTNDTDEQLLLDSLVDEAMEETPIEIQTTTVSCTNEQVSDKQPLLLHKPRATVAL